MHRSFADLLCRAWKMDFAGYLMITKDGLPQTYYTGSNSMAHLWYFCIASFMVIEFPIHCISTCSVLRAEDRGQKERIIEQSERGHEVVSICSCLFLDLFELVALYQ